jgi:hypothetical protein
MRCRCDDLHVNLVPTDRGTEMREVYDTTRCEGCRGLLAAPHVLIAHLPYSRVPGRLPDADLPRERDDPHYEPGHDASRTC